MCVGANKQPKKKKKKPPHKKKKKKTNKISTPQTKKNFAPPSEEATQQENTQRPAHGRRRTKHPLSTVRHLSPEASIFQHTAKDFFFSHETPPSRGGAPPHPPPIHSRPPQSTRAETHTTPDTPDKPTVSPPRGPPSLIFAISPPTETPHTQPPLLEDLRDPPNKSRIFIMQTPLTYPEAIAISL